LFLSLFSFSKKIKKEAETPRIRVKHDEG